MASNCCTDITSCNGLTYSSNCVLWADEGITNYNIEKGDNLTSIITNITDSLDTLFDGKDIMLSEVTLNNCSIIADLMSSKTKTLTNVVQTLVDYQCTLKSYIDERTNTTPHSYDSKCFTFADSKESTIIQTLINQSCTNTTDISNIKGDITTNTSSINTLKTQVKSILGDEASTTPAFTFSQLCPLDVALPYMGALSNFDSTGKGLSSKGFDNVYVMNGNNGTIDMRGYIPMGANSGIAGATMDKRVNPTDNSGFAIKQGQRSGEIYHSLTTTEMPSHTHTITDPGHTHNYNGPKTASHPGGGKNTEARYSQSLTTTSSKTGITIANTGGGKGHNNIQPSIGVVWIMKKL